MKREDIEKAAGDYSGSILGFRDNKSVMDKHKSFADGAVWRINSAWHAMDEAQDGKRPYIVEMNAFGKKKYLIFTKPLQQAEISCQVYKRWAYIRDLLPEED